MLVAVAVECIMVLQLAVLEAMAVVVQVVILQLLELLEQQILAVAQVGEVIVVLLAQTVVQGWL
jgi:hypothetical protein